MKQPYKCSKCENPFYASYKGKYYCPIHLEEKLAQEKRLIANNGIFEN
ncbi:MAG: hypothetical protein ACFFAE_00735 [Candidatus Hodarchaeota archaeon]